jgi:hypothetical protein
MVSGMSNGGTVAIKCLTSVAKAWQGRDIHKDRARFARRDASRADVVSPCVKYVILRIQESNHGIVLCLLVVVSHTLTFREPAELGA